MLFDESGHPVDHKKIETLSARTAVRYQWRRCYKLVSLLHTDRARSFCPRVAARLIPGNDHECPVFYDMFDAFVEEVGPGVVRRLILDRGFLDGDRIGRCKKRHGVDVLIPLRKNMDLYYKCYWDLAGFTSRCFSLVLNQIVFVILAYNLLQLYLRAQARKDLQRRTRPRQRGQLLPSDTVIILYCDERFAMLSPLAYTELLLTLGDPARKKILEKTRRLRREIIEELPHPRPP